VGRIAIRQWHGTALVAAFLLFAATLPRLSDSREPLPDRWFYAAKNITDEKQFNDLNGLVDTAAAHGLNGVLLSAAFDYLDRVGPKYFENLAKLRAHCESRGIEVIPSFMSIGYGGGLLSHDPNLAEGLPVRDALFVVRGRQAQLVPDPPVEIRNGDFERWKDNRFADFNFHDQPGKISFVDQKVFKSGRASIRFESFENDPVNGHARILQMVPVHPHRAYVVSLWVKTQDLAGGKFSVQVYSRERSLTHSEPRLPSATDWRQVSMAFNSLDTSMVRIYAGVWGAKSGRFWIDDMRIEEVGLVNVLRRPGTPVTIKSEASGTVYEEGRDFEKIADPRMRIHEAYHEPPAIRLTVSSRIKDGERLRVSWYHPVVIGSGQITACMSEPKVYEIYQKQVELLHKHLAPKKYFLSMDEIRAGGSCAACRAQKKSMGEILGDCITKQYELIKAVNPNAEVYIWSDMLDPNHNAHGAYYMVEGDFSGSWNYIPKDMVIACWYYKMRDKSLQHFSRLGFGTIGAAYYDGDDLENCKGWLRSLRATPGARGIMYTTWQNKYALMAPFGDMLVEEAK
jgi:hypothetical protein